MLSDNVRPKKGAPIRILVVDDEESLRAVVSETLKEDGYEVDTASSGEVALARCRAKPYPLVITDIRMGGMDGIELLQTVKRRFPDTQVVIMTSYASIESAISAMRSGAYDYLIKPFEDLDMISAVANRAAEKVGLLARNRELVETLKRRNTELERTNEVLRKLSLRDELTGLHNDNYLQEALALELKRSKEHGRNFSLVELQVDRWKDLVREKERQQGDEVLRKLSKILQMNFSGEALPVRYREGSFVLLLPEFTRERAVQVAEKVRAGVERFPFGARNVFPPGAVTVSAGVAMFPDDGRDGPSLFEQLSRALFKANRDGGNSVMAAGGTAAVPGR